jgi:cytochrome oxidase Cu insertion factor (SCO1/SenC/PrrC family)
LIRWRRIRWNPLWVAAVLVAATSTSTAGVDPVGATAPRMEFLPPAPGSYQLQHIQQSPDGTLFDSHAQPIRLAAHTTGKITLLTFFYTYCMDPWGCPFAHETLSTLRQQLLAEPKLAARVRFVSVSFDPTNDTPAALARYGSEFAESERFEWDFLTARSVPELLPVLEGFGQDVSVQLDASGHPTRTMHHMLKMFLIDRDGVVREIYSLAYLQPQVMLNDIKTLALEERESLAAEH